MKQQKVDPSCGVNQPGYRVGAVTEETAMFEALPDDVFVARGSILHGPVFHVVLGPGEPPDAARIQIEEVFDVHESLVEDHDFPGKNCQTNFPSALLAPPLWGDYGWWL